MGRPESILTLEDVLGYYGYPESILVLKDVLDYNEVPLKYFDLGR